MKQNKLIPFFGGLFIFALIEQAQAQTTISIPIADIISATGTAPSYDSGYLLPDGTRIKARSVSLGRGAYSSEHGFVDTNGLYGGPLNGNPDINNTSIGDYALTLSEYTGKKDVNLFTRISSSDRRTIDGGLFNGQQNSNGGVFQDAIGFHIWSDKQIEVKQLLLIDADGNPGDENQEWFTAFGYAGSNSVKPVVKKFNSGQRSDSLMSIFTTNNNRLSVNWINEINNSFDIAGSSNINELDAKHIIYNNHRFSPLAPNHYTDPDEIRIQGLFDFGTNKVNNLFVFWGLTGIPDGFGLQNSGVSPLVFNYDFDFGDAPATYGTVINLQELVRPHTGPVHIVNPDKKVYLGSGVTKDAIAVASDNADTDALDDGVQNITLIDRSLSPNANFTLNSYSVEVSYHNEDDLGKGYLIGYIDWNNNGVFDESEASSHIVTNEVNGVVTLQWNNIAVTNHGEKDHTYLRLRYSSDPLIAKTNQATNTIYYEWEYTPNGEIEDYVIPFFDEPLPSDLLSFSAKAIGQDVLLEWAVTDQKSMKDYSLYRSVDGVKYNHLTSMASDNSLLQHFAFTDTMPKQGINIYQLRSEEFDGTIKVLGRNQIVYVDAVNIGSFIYPNPATHEVNIKIASIEQQAVLYIYNSLGQLVKKELLTVGINKVNVSSYSRGTYVFELRYGDLILSSNKVILK